MVYYGGTDFLILCFRNALGLEGRQRSNNRSTNRGSVVPFIGCDNLYSHGSRSKAANFLVQTISETGKQGGPTGLFITHGLLGFYLGIYILNGKGFTKTMLA